MSGLMSLKYIYCRHEYIVHQSRALVRANNQLDLVWEVMPKSVL